MTSFNLKNGVIEFSPWSAIPELDVLHAGFWPWQRSYSQRQAFLGKNPISTVDKEILVAH